MFSRASIREYHEEPETKEQASKRRKSRKHWKRAHP